MPGDSLFATTALVATAGIASAQGIELSGSAGMGYAGGAGAEGFLSEFDVRFSGTGETDNGLTFGATIDLEDASDSPTTETIDQFADFTVFISGAFGTLTLGDTDGAMDWAITEAAGGAGSLNDDETGHAGYLGGNPLDGLQNGQILRYDYSFGDFAFAVSVDGEDQVGIDTGVGVGVRYSLGLAAGSVDFGLAYQTTEVAARGVAGPGVVGPAVNAAPTLGGVGLNAGTDVDAWAASVALALDSGFSGAIAYTDIDHNQAGTADFEHLQLSAGYAFGPFAAGVNYGEFSGASNRSGYGISGSYDLGGGATFHVGYGRGDIPGAPDVDSYSLGVAMSF